MNDWLVMTQNEIEQQLQHLSRGAEEILPLNQLQEKLSKKKSLKIKLGCDPTAPDIHLGHTVILNKLKQFQDFGHVVYFVVGDFTAMVGDPTGKKTTRPQLDSDTLRFNAQTYANQVFKILNPDLTQVVFNSEWLSALGSEGLIRLSAHYTLARLLEREDFSKRHKENVPISVHELLYPLLQGYDSVELQSDVELGGTDQKFNLLVGRELQKAHHQEPQVILTMPLLEGTDGQQKMSKSLNNYIGITESPQTIFGKIMSISDPLMWRYYDQLSFKPIAAIQELKSAAERGANPRDFKLALAAEMVQRFHGIRAAENAQQDFINQFKHKHIPEDIPTLHLKYPHSSDSQQIWIAHVLKDAALANSTSEAVRQIKQGAVKIDQLKIEDPQLQLQIHKHYLIQYGKKTFLQLYLDL